MKKTVKNTWNAADHMTLYVLFDLTEFQGLEEAISCHRNTAHAKAERVSCWYLSCTIAFVQTNAPYVTLNKILKKTGWSNNCFHVYMCILRTFITCRVEFLYHMSVLTHLFRPDYAISSFNTVNVISNIYQLVNIWPQFRIISTSQTSVSGIYFLHLISSKSIKMQYFS